MSLSSLSSAQLYRLVKLVKEKETIQTKLTQLKDFLTVLEAGLVAKEKPTLKGGPRRRRRRIALKGALLEKLKAAGKKGITVKELAASLKAKPTSVSVWFYTTGKKIKEVKKVGAARYAYVVK